jgi:hypothetical protein
MDLGYLKVKIDIKSEHDEFKKKYNLKKKELKKEEIKNIFDSFKEFFKNDGNFKFKENEHSVMAEYKDHGIKLELDIYKNIESEDFDLNGTVETYEREVFEILVQGVCNQDLTLQPAFVDDNERMVHETRHYKDFINGDVTYHFEYKIVGREEVHGSMLELMQAL